MADQGNGTCQNPVLNANYSDPDVMRSAPITTSPLPASTAGAPEAHFLNVPDSHTVLGTKRVGETSITRVAAAVANAVYHAAGIRVRELLITLSKPF